MHTLTPNVLKWHKGEVCLLRADLDVPHRERKGSLRLELLCDTVRKLLRHNIRVVLMGHLGRPQFAGDRKYSLRSMGKFLSQELLEPVHFFPEHDFAAIREKVQKGPARLFLLENLRFSLGEEENDRRFTKELTSIADFYVNEAFASSHRAHASIVGVPRFLPSFAGPTFEREIRALGEILKRRARPLVVLVGGAKISDKLGIIQNLWKRADVFLLGGGPANTLFAAQGIPMKDSLVDYDALPRVKQYAFSPKVAFPVDVKMRGTKVWDIGPRTAREYAEIIGKAETVIWSGPMGVFEKKGYEAGTLVIWKAVLANKRARIVVGGGETLASLRILNTKYKIPATVFLSTGGGAMLEYLAGKKLPGIEALKS